MVNYEVGGSGMMIDFGIVYDDKFIKWFIEEGDLPEGTKKYKNCRYSD